MDFLSAGVGRVPVRVRVCVCMCVCARWVTTPMHAGLANVDRALYSSIIGFPLMSIYSSVR